MKVFPKEKISRSKETFPLRFAFLYISIFVCCLFQGMWNPFGLLIISLALPVAPHPQAPGLRGVLEHLCNHKNNFAGVQK